MYISTQKHTFIYKAHVMAHIFIYLCIGIHYICVLIHNQFSAYCLTTQLQESEPYFFPDTLHKLGTKPCP